MEKEEFIKEFEENVVYVSVGSINEYTILSELEEWDSMASVATMALIDEYFNITLNAEKLTSCKTLGDIFLLINERLKG